jgi:hypothetical protein
MPAQGAYRFTRQLFEWPLPTKPLNHPKPFQIVAEVTRDVRNTVKFIVLQMGA